MSKHIIFTLILVSFFACKNENKQANKPANKKPNILFVMTDDHARAAISSYGSQIIKTPNIDRLANQGTRFTNYGITNAICGPSRAVILTGKYSHINGFKDNRSRFDASQQTFPKILQKAGYQTMMIGKWHLQTKPEGFDYWNILVDQGQYYTPTMVNNGDTINYRGYVTDIITDLSLEQLEKRDPSKPFCMMYQQKAPHRNWMPNVKHLELFKDDTIPLPNNFFDDYTTRSAAAKEQDMEVKNMFLSFDMKLNPNTLADSTETGTGGSATWPPIPSWKHSYSLMSDSERVIWDNHYNPIAEEYYNKDFSPEELAKWKYQRYMKDYLRCIVSVDENLGRMIDYLKTTGEWENTLIVYTSDQGFFLGEHGWFDKRFMYEESFITPLIMKLPNDSTAKINNALAMNIDLAPTLLDYVGLPIPNDMQGKSLKPSIEGKGFDRKGQYYHYYEYPHGWHKVKKHYGVRTKQYKLIHFYQDIDSWEMYDLKNDPQEMNNIYGKTEYAAQQEELLLLLKELRKNYKDEE